MLTVCLVLYTTLFVLHRAHFLMLYKFSASQLPGSVIINHMCIEMWNDTLNIFHISTTLKYVLQVHVKDHADDIKLMLFNANIEHHAIYTYIICLICSRHDHKCICYLVYIFAQEFSIMTCTCIHNFTFEIQIKFCLISVCVLW